MSPSSPIDEIEACKYLYVEEISEPEVNSLRLLISEGIVSSTRDTLKIGDVSVPGVSAIEVMPESRWFELVWDTYVSYSVRNESYCQWDDSEEWTGRSFRIYRKSKFLDFIRHATFATSEYPGPFDHYQVSCSHHVVDVASKHPPRVRRVVA